MEKIDLSKQFSLRLRDAMLEAGFASTRSTSGIDIHKLTEITGYSEQICRKYLKGKAIPEPAKLVDIAHALNVSPGWLLFGEQHQDILHNKNQFVTNKNIIEYVFKRYPDVYNAGLNADEAARFMSDLLLDLSLIHTSDDAQARKIIDLAIASLTHYRNKDHL